MRPIYGVRPSFYGGQAGARDQLGGLFARGFDRYDAVGVAVNDQSGYVYTRDVLAEVLMPCGDAGEARRGRGTGGYVPTGFDDLFADALAEEDIRVEEVLKELGEERITVRSNSFLNPLEHTAVHAIGVVVCFQQGHWSRITKAGIVQAPWESLPAKGFNTSKRFKTSGEWQWLSTRPGDIE